MRMIRNIIIIAMKKFYKAYLFMFKINSLFIMKIYICSKIDFILRKINDYCVKNIKS